MPKPTENCPACSRSVSFVIVGNQVVMAGTGDLAAERLCVDCWNHGPLHATPATPAEPVGASS